MKDENLMVIEEDAKQLEAEQVAEDELVMAISHGLSAKEWQE
ncbi:hypothetical protein ACVBGC_28965 [Burkholderia stagnalis]|nr:hypothetical protein [Burkholderia vietnamiensis]